MFNKYYEIEQTNTERSKPSTSVSLGVKTDAKFSGVPWSKWQVDTPLFDRLSAGHSGRRYQLHGKGYAKS
ncbi:hypothetical protein T4C_10779 [Trichinella pseudospiralis]|uniref:Uncharacterized protein n=1 Tax=Trichinella pseudospiralis TaxID=6337 RepID=A0A0V1K0G6_TRIPS|nr:hypothetical protein T4C_10779 [Trichinella pseudospiralis]